MYYLSKTGGKFHLLQTKETGSLMLTVSETLMDKRQRKGDLRRIPAIVVKGSLSHPLYQLACKFITPEGLFAASKLKLSWCR